MRKLEDWAWSKGIVTGAAVAGFPLVAYQAYPNYWVTNYGYTKAANDQYWMIIIFGTWIVVGLAVALLADK